VLCGDKQETCAVPPILSKSLNTVLVVVMFSTACVVVARNGTGSHYVWRNV